jgi:serine/threonine-protein kinase HipA
MRFLYENADRPLSISMPIRDEPYTNKACEAFFGGLLPENMQAKKKLAILFGISSASNFGLLEKIGFDCAGAVSVLANVEPDAEDTPEIEGRPITDAELRQYLIELPKKPLFAGVDGIRISLAGAQAKAALCLIENKLCIPATGVPSTHILKPSITGLASSVENEYFSMRLAKLIGLLVCNVEIRKALDIEYLLIERYDRVILEDKIYRIHQEDFCQALGVVSTKKYQADGGPNLIDCINLVEKSATQPAKDKLELVKRIIYNVLIGNADAHAKNFSVLHLDDGAIALTPAYDILSTVIYAQTTSKLAMSIGAESNIDDLRSKNWTKFHTQARLQKAAFKRLCEDMIGVIQDKVPVLKVEMEQQTLWVPALDELLQGIEQRTMHLREILPHL